MFPVTGVRFLLPPPWRMAQSVGAATANGARAAVGAAARIQDSTSAYTRFSEDATGAHGVAAGTPPYSRKGLIGRAPVLSSTPLVSVYSSRLSSDSSRPKPDCL